MLVVSERICETQVHRRDLVAQSGGLDKFGCFLPLRVVSDGQPRRGGCRNQPATPVLPAPNGQTSGQGSDAVAIIWQRTPLLFCAESADSIELTGTGPKFKSARASRDSSPTTRHGDDFPCRDCNVGDRWPSNKLPVQYRTAHLSHSFLFASSNRNHSAGCPSP